MPPRFPPFCCIQGLETEPDLPPECLQSFHRLILGQNVNPTKIALFVQRNPVLMEHRLKVVRLLEKLCAKWFKATNPTMYNEARAIKMSYLACVLREMGKTHVEKNDNGATFVKFLVKARESDMFPIGQVEGERGRQKHAHTGRGTDTHSDTHTHRLIY